MDEQQVGGAVVIGPEEGTRLGAGPIRLTLRVTSEHTSKFTLLEYHVPPRFAAPPTLHHHTREDWAAHVLDGEPVYVFADREVVAPAGATVFVPAGADFAWRNDRDNPLGSRPLHSPAGGDQGDDV